MIRLLLLALLMASCGKHPGSSPSDTVGATDTTPGQSGPTVLDAAAFQAAKTVIEEALQKPILVEYFAMQAFLSWGGQAPGDTLQDHANRFKNEVNSTLANRDKFEKIVSEKHNMMLGAPAYRGRSFTEIFKPLTEELITKTCTPVVAGMKAKVRDGQSQAERVPLNTEFELTRPDPYVVFLLFKDLS